jgi:hypothetical protein
VERLADRGAAPDEGLAQGLGVGAGGIEDRESLPVIGGGFGVAVGALPDGGPAGAHSCGPDRAG